MSLSYKEKKHENLTNFEKWSIWKKQLFSFNRYRIKLDKLDVLILNDKDYHNLREYN